MNNASCGNERGDIEYHPMASILQTTQLRKEFGRLVAVNDVELRVERGEVWGLIGPNGAGKTTLLRLLATLIRPTRGTARILECDLLEDFLQIRKGIGFLPDFFNLYSDLTLEECLSYFARAYGVARMDIAGRVDKALEYVQLVEKRESLIRKLSRGMVQRLGVASLIVRDPELYLLDEPASGLDPKARTQLRHVLKKLSEEGRTVIISSHILTELSGLCSHIALMDKGKIVSSGEVETVRQEALGDRKTIVTVLEDVEKARKLIEALEGVNLLQVNDLALTVQIHDGLARQAEMNAHLVNAGIKVVRIEEEKADLEEVFMTISEDWAG